MGFPGGSGVKNQLVNVGDGGSIPGSGRLPGEEMAMHSTIFAWKTPWTEEPGWLQSMGLTQFSNPETIRGEPNMCFLVFLGIGLAPVVQISYFNLLNNVH